MKRLIAMWEMVSVWEERFLELFSVDRARIGKLIECMARAGESKTLNLKRAIEKQEFIPNE